MLKGTPRIKLKIMCCKVKNVKILKIGSRNNNFEMVYVTEHIIRIMAFLETLTSLWKSVQLIFDLRRYVTISTQNIPFHNVVY